MSKNTPGPWKAIRTLAGDTFITTPDPGFPFGTGVQSIAKIHTNDILARAQDAALMAAAPELLEAAKFALISLSAAATRLGDDNLYASARAELREAIAKAEGRES